MCGAEKAEEKKLNVERRVRCGCLGVGGLTQIYTSQTANTINSRFDKSLTSVQWDKRSVYKTRAPWNADRGKRLRDKGDLG